MYAVYCHGDAPDQRTLADEHAIRPLLSQAEKAVVKEHMEKLHAQKEAEAALARVEAERQRRLQAEAAAVQAAADAEKRRADEAKAKEEAELFKKAEFKRKLTENGLGPFIGTFLENGYDTEDSLELMIESELTDFGLKPAHVAKFHIAFPRGERYVVSNVNLCSSAPGVTYKIRSPSGSISEDSFRLARFGSIVIGTELTSGFLKVGTMYLPMQVDGKQVMYREGSEPEKSGSTEPESMLEKVEEEAEHVAGRVREEVGHVASVVGAVASKVDSKLHEFAHMLHFF
jgi:hypothetical protein